MTLVPDTGAKKLPQVTLSLKAFNQEKLIGEAIASCFAQTYSPLEIILSDDCSSDATYAIMTEMAAGYRGPHTIVLNCNPTNLGVVGHLNRIAELASGRLLVDASGDDIAEPTRVERLAEAWIAGNGRIKAVHARFTVIDQEGVVLGEAGPPEVVIDSPTPLSLVQSGVNCNGATAAWDLELFERFGPIPEQCHVSDGPLFFRAALLEGIAFVDAPLVRYRMGGISSRRRASPGFDYLYGDRIRTARWRVSNIHSFRRDLESTDIAERDACLRLCDEIAARAAHEVDLADRRPVTRVTAVPASLAKTVRTGDRFYLVQSLKHALGVLFVSYYDARQRMMGRFRGKHRGVSG